MVAVAAMTNRPQCSAASRLLSSVSTASTPSAAASARPKAKLPCRLAQSGISSSSHQLGAVPRSRAATSPSVQAASSGKASRCGRASSDASTQDNPSNVASKAGNRSSRLRKAPPTIAAAAPNAMPNKICKLVQPLAQPPARQTERHQDFGQPFLRIPGRAGPRVGKDIGAQHGMMVQHPFAGTDMPIGVGVIEKGGRESRHANPASPANKAKVRAGERRMVRMVACCATLYISKSSLLGCGSAGPWPSL